MVHANSIMQTKAHNIGRKEQKYNVKKCRYYIKKAVKLFSIFIAIFHNKISFLYFDFFSLRIADGGFPIYHI